MKIIDWNLSWLYDSNKKIDFLLNETKNHSFIIILQEVTLSSYEAIYKAFAKDSNIEYSLNYRIPGKFDTNSRKLGIAIITSRNFIVKNAQVLGRSIMPDRTLMVDIECGRQRLRILGLHSITGSQHGKAKEIQYYSFAEAISEYRPDIVGIDANEPQLDHYDVFKMEFFDNYNKGNGCKTFFTTMVDNTLEDAYVKNYDRTKFVKGEYLTTSHIIQQGRKKVRYDFLFVNKEKFNDYNCVYDYNQAINAGSDHAAIILSTINKEINMEWNHKIKQARKAIGMTQEVLADKMQVHRSTIANYELARRKPTFMELKRLADILCVDVNYLVESSSINPASNLLTQTNAFFSDPDISLAEKDILFQEIFDAYRKEKEMHDDFELTENTLPNRDSGAPIEDIPLPDNTNSGSLKSLQKKYWEYALEILHKQFGDGSFSGVNPIECSYISGFVGINGVKITCFVSTDNSIRTELRMERSDSTFNKMVFDTLFNQKDSIEKALQSSLLWNRNDNKISSNIGIKLDNVNLKNELDWCKMAQFHANWAKKFYDVLNPILNKAGY